MTPETTTTRLSHTPSPSSLPFSLSFSLSLAGVDDDEFSASTGEKRETSTLLSHYDEEARVAAARERRGMVLTGQGKVRRKDEDEGEEGGEGREKEKKRMALSLGGGGEKRALDDYLSVAEMEKFKRPKKMRKKKQRRKKVCVEGGREGREEGRREGGREGGVPVSTGCIYICYACTLCSLDL